MWLVVEAQIAETSDSQFSKCQTRPATRRILEFALFCPFLELL